MSERTATSLSKSALYGALSGVVVCIAILLLISWQSGKWGPCATSFPIIECLRFALVFALIFLGASFVFNKVTGRGSK